MTVPKAEFESRVGGEYLIQMQEPSGEVYTVSGVVKEFSPIDKISYAWKWDMEDAVETLVSFSFRSCDGGTEMTLNHTRFQTEKSREAHKEGWEGCFDNYEKFISN